MDKSIIARIQDYGFLVYMRRPDDTYLIYTNPRGDRLGYFQHNRDGFTICTVHVPSSVYGTGFQIVRNAADFTKDDMMIALACTIPSWAREKDKTIAKYANIDAYITANKFNSEYKLVMFVGDDVTPESGIVHGADLRAHVAAPISAPAKKYNCTHVDKNGLVYIGAMLVTNGVCYEDVTYEGNKIHAADFPASNLGDADPDGYVRVMTESIADMHRRLRNARAH